MHPSTRRARSARRPTTRHSRSRVAALTLACVVIPTSVHAEDVVTSLDAAAYLARFEVDNPSYAVADAEVAARRSEVTGASLLPNPTLSFEREQLYPDDGSAVENTVAIGWSLDLSGSRSRRVTAARGRARAAGALAERDKLLALIDALAAFYDGAHARLQLTALREGREPLARLVDAVERRAKAGDVAGYDAARLQLELASYDERITEARAALDAARRVLGGAIGEPSALVDAADELAPPAVPADPAALTGDALAARGDLRATALAESSAASALAAADRAWLPSLDLGVGIKTADDGVDRATGYYAMVGIELPLFSRGQATAERARADQRAARARRAALEREISTRIQIAHARLTAAVEQVHTYRVAQLEPASALVAKAEAVYQGGEGSVVELLDAHRTAVEVRLRYLSLLRRAKQAELDLLVTLGRRPELGSR